jgi:hypothetical protein
MKIKIVITLLFFLLLLFVCKNQPNEILIEEHEQSLCKQHELEQIHLQTRASMILFEYNNFDLTKSQEKEKGKIETIFNVFLRTEINLDMNIEEKNITEEVENIEKQMLYFQKIIMLNSMEEKKEELNDIIHILNKVDIKKIKTRRDYLMYVQKRRADLNIIFHTSIKGIPW